MSLTLFQSVSFFSVSLSLNYFSFLYLSPLYLFLSVSFFLSLSISINSISIFLLRLITLYLLSLSLSLALADGSHARRSNIWPPKSSLRSWIPKRVITLLGPNYSDRRKITSSLLSTSVTRMGNLLDFGQLFKAFGNN